VQSNSKPVAIAAGIFLLLTLDKIDIICYIAIVRQPRGNSMKTLFNLKRKFASALLVAAGITLMAPALAQQRPLVGTVPAVSAAPIGGMLPDLIVLRFIGGRTLEVSNPSRAAGGRPHELVAAENGISSQCQSWKEITPRPGFGFAAEITQICSR